MLSDKIIWYKITIRFTSVNIKNTHAKNEFIIWENQPGSEKKMITSVTFTSSEYAVVQNLKRHLRVRHSSFSLFPLASSCSNDISAYL